MAYADLLGEHESVKAVRALVARIAESPVRQVLLYGETGTGKGLVARMIHRMSPRANRPFVDVNCAAIPATLMESELFGHERGAFTGALQRNQGRFEQANGGTLFLDEIGDMPPEAQTRLLRVLQEGEFTTVGGRTPIRVNVRIVAATHRDLRALIRQGMFREDLFYRLNVVPMRLPPLRERTEDVPLLARHFLSQAKAKGLPAKTLTAEAVERLKEYPWPGNVRELENLMRRLAALYPQETIGEDVIGAELAEAAPPAAPATAAPAEPESMAQSVERHLRAYFASHKDGLPASGVYDRVIAEVERPLIRLYRALDFLIGDWLQ